MNEREVIVKTRSGTSNTLFWHKSISSSFNTHKQTSTTSTRLPQTRPPCEKRGIGHLGKQWLILQGAGSWQRNVNKFICSKFKKGWIVTNNIFNFHSVSCKKKKIHFVPLIVTAVERKLTLLPPDPLDTCTSPCDVYSMCAKLAETISNITCCQTDAVARQAAPRWCRGSVFSQPSPS